MSRCFISGITGQDGSYLAEQLLAEGHEVTGLVRRASTNNLERLAAIVNHARLRLVQGDLADGAGVLALMKEAAPQRVWNLAALSFVPTSWETPASCMQITAVGAVNMLEAFRRVCPEGRFYQASSSEMFGNAAAPQSETTPFQPCSPYAVAKVAAHQAAVCYRENFGLHVSCGILFNHESERRGEEFVTRKITKAVAQISMAKKQDNLCLGNPNARRDWGYAPDYVRGMRIMLEQDKPGDYVLATGHAYSVETFVREAFEYAGIYDWSRRVTWTAALRRESEVHHLCGDARKALKELHWLPMTTFTKLVKVMVDHDLAEEFRR